MKGHFYITPTSSSPVFVTEHGCWLSETCFPHLKWCIFISKLLRDHCEQQCSPTYLIIISELTFFTKSSHAKLDTIRMSETYLNSYVVTVP